jgi:hypothetical protein
MHDNERDLTHLLDASTGVRAPRGIHQRADLVVRHQLAAVAQSLGPAKMLRSFSAVGCVGRPEWMTLALATSKAAWS